MFVNKPLTLSSPSLTHLSRIHHPATVSISQLLRGNIQTWCVLFSVALAVFCHISVWQWLSLKWVILARLTAQRSGEDVPARCADRANAEHRDKQEVWMCTCTPAQTKYWGQHNSFHTHILKNALYVSTSTADKSRTLLLYFKTSASHNGSKIRVCTILPSLHPQCIHPSIRASVHPLCACFSHLSSGPVQSESLVGLGLVWLISKGCVFHLSKCLHSQLLYEEADKGCLLIQSR